MQKKDKYKLTLAGESFKAFITDLLIKGGYNHFVHIYDIQSKPSSEAYISTTEQQKLAKEGLMLYTNEKRMSRLIKNGQNFSLKIRVIILKTKKGAEFSKRTNLELEKILKTFCFYTIKLLRIYRFTEIMYSLKAEETIKRYVHGKTNNENRARHFFNLLFNFSKDKKVFQKRKEVIASLRMSEKIENLCQSVQKIRKKRTFFRLNLAPLAQIL